MNASHGSISNEEFDGQQMSEPDIEMAATSLPRRRSTSSSLSNQCTGNGTEHASLPLAPPLIASSLQHRDHLPSERPASLSLPRKVLVIIVCFVGTTLIYFVGSSTNAAIASRGIRFGSEDLSRYHQILKDKGIRKYELMPDINARHGRLLENVGQDALDLRLSVLDSTYDLLLSRPDDEFLAANYEEIFVDEDGSEVIDFNQTRCIYSASLRGDPNSFGTVSFCDGEMRAILFHETDSHKELVITPISEHMHVAFRQLSGHDKQIRSCPEKHLLDDSNGRSLVDKTASEPWKPIGKKNKVVDLVIVNDALRSRTKKERRSSRASALTIMNTVNRFYSQLSGPNMYGIKFRIVVQVSLRKDPWANELNEKNPDSQELLEKFYEWKRNAKLPKAHLVHLFSGREHKDGYVGRSAQAGITDGGVCTERNVGVSQVTGFNLALYAKIVAHELGHSLAAIHDDEFSTCSNNSNTFMWSAIPIDEGTVFSSCTAETIKKFFEGKTLYPYKGCLD